MAKIIVGKFGQPYGVKGWIKVHSQTDPIENILKYLPWQIEQQGQWQKINVTDSKKLGKNIIAKLENYDTPEVVKILTNSPIAIERDQLPQLSPDQYYWNDLIGLKVVNLQGEDLGIVDSLFETGSNDVMVIKGLRQRLLPYTNQVVHQINIAKKTITVDWDPEF